jgi:DnaJ-class molecular chaperone
MDVNKRGLLITNERKNVILNKVKELNLQIDPCKDCNGTGLSGVTTWINSAGVKDHTWGGSYCDNCNTFGFTLPDKDHVLYFCEYCGGLGYETTWYNLENNICKGCNGEGIVYWIDNLRGNQNVGHL